MQNRLIQIRFAVCGTETPLYGKLAQWQSNRLLTDVWSFDYFISRHYGELAQLGEHYSCKVGVMSSNLIFSTKGMY